MQSAGHHNRIGLLTTFQKTGRETNQADHIIALAAIHRRANGIRAKADGVVTEVAVNGAHRNTTNRDAVVVFFRGTGIRTKDRRTTLQLTRDDHGVSAAAAQYLAGTEGTSNAHQVVTGTAVQRGGRRCATNNQLVIAEVAVQRRG